MNNGVWYAIGAYVFWGLFPIYWKTLASVPALQLLGHRVVWSFLLLVFALLISRKWKEFKANLNPRVIVIYVIAAILIGINWLTYVWAIGAGYIVETSLGYFINPLVNVLLGVIFLRETLRITQWIPLGVASLGVLYLTFAYGSLPWIALTLAISFGLYGLVKKTAPLSPSYGLSLETGILFLPALAFLSFSEISGKGIFLHATSLINWMLVGAGAVTVFPLLLFASAARKISLTSLGVLQYINPTMQFLLGVLVYHESFNIHRLVGFSIVWVALIVYGIEGFTFSRKIRKTQLKENLYLK